MLLGTGESSFSALPSHWKEAKVRFCGVIGQNSLCMLLKCVVIFKLLLFNESITHHFNSISAMKS